MIVKLIRFLAKPFFGTHLGRNPFAKKIYEALIYILNPVAVQNYRMFLNPKNDMLGLLVNPDFETMERGLFKKYIKPGDTVIDVGASIGVHTLLMADLAGKEGRVFAFEPTPKSFELLEKNIKINGFQNVITVRQAASDRSGSGKLYIYPSSGANRIFEPENSRSFLEIETVRLDDVVKGKVNFVKIDVEGAEQLVLKGMPKILSQDIKLIMEFNPDADNGLDPKETLRILKDNGFEIYGIRKKNRELAKVRDISDIEEIKKSRNLFCQKS